MEALAPDRPAALTVLSAHWSTPERSPPVSPGADVQQELAECCAALRCDMSGTLSYPMSTLSGIVEHRAAITSSSATSRFRIPWRTPPRWCVPLCAIHPDGVCSLVSSAHSHARAHSCRHSFTCAEHARTHARTHSCTRADTRTHACTRAHACTHSCTRADTRTHARTCARAHTHACTRRRVRFTHTLALHTVHAPNARARARRHAEG